MSPTSLESDIVKQDYELHEGDCIKVCVPLHDVFIEVEGILRKHPYSHDSVFLDSPKINERDLLKKLDALRGQHSMRVSRRAIRDGFIDRIKSAIRKK